MKVLLLGSLISQLEMEELNRNSKEKASVAPVNYETMLVRGLHENGVDIEALSVPAISAFPNSTYKRIKRKKEVIDDSITIQWIPFVNIQGIKQYSIRNNSYRLLKKWLIRNQHIKEKLVMMYSIYPPYSEVAMKLCKKYNTHLCGVIADLPELMYTWKNPKGIRGLYSRFITRKMVNLQDKCNSYILFTELMASRMGIKDHPYIVSEGFGDVHAYDGISCQNKASQFTFLYGGNLSSLYGVESLVRGFMATDINAELHLYGYGSDVDFINKCSNNDSRIKYHGRVEKKELLKALKGAHVLVVNKPTSDEYSKYSFSSKILEYMASGTPVLTTRVGGMPQEYYPYVYFIEDESVEGIARVLTKCASISQEELDYMGKAAKEFVLKKDYRAMTNEIVSFLNGQIRATS